MNRFFRLFLLPLLLFSLTLGTAGAAVNVKVGKEVFQANCRTCHSASGEGGNLNPAEKTRAQWRRFFKKLKHPEQTEIFDKLSEDEMKSLRLFLDHNAADADHAETCG
jgi:mono/diheme cytochrome c family protein